MSGRIHSLESFGTVDGPGARFVVFVQGCPMRCAYCHNPDTWPMTGGTVMEASEIIEQYERNKPFYANGGGLTVCYVGSNGKDGCCRNTVSVGVVSSDCRNKFVYDILSDFVYAVIVIAVFREVACCLKVNNNAVFIANNFNFGIFDSGQGVSYDGKTCNTRCEVTLNISVM